MQHHPKTSDLFCSPFFMIASAIASGALFASWYYLLVVAPIFGVLASLRVRRGFARLRHLLGVGATPEEIQADPLAAEALDRLSTPLDRELTTTWEYYPVVFLVAAGLYLAFGFAVFALRAAI